MPSHSLARRAESDLKSIGSYTLKIWGKTQATRYIEDLHECCQLLAGNPLLGRPCDPLGLGLRRHEIGKHVIFYLPQPDGILVVRILHQQMLPTKPRLNWPSDS